MLAAFLFFQESPSAQNIDYLSFLQLMEYMARHHDDLLKMMPDEQKEIFEKFDDCWSEYMSHAEAAIFEYAFKLGARLMMETQQDD